MGYYKFENGKLIDSQSCLKKIATGYVLENYITREIMPVGSWLYFENEDQAKEAFGISDKMTIHDVVENQKYIIEILNERGLL